MNIEVFKLILEICSYLITVIGAPIAIYLYFKEKRIERQEREYGTYNALDDKYFEFLHLCLEYPDLGIYHMEDKNVELSYEQKVRRDIIFEILVCLFERAFLMYGGHKKVIKKKQWEGWNAYMKNWMENNHFRYVWSTFLNSQYDKDFLTHMNAIYEEVMKNIENTSDEMREN